MKNRIDSNFAIAILALVAACVGFSFWFLSVSDEIGTAITPVVQPTQKNAPNVSESDSAADTTFQVSQQGKFSADQFPSSSIDVITWKMYTDSEFGYQVNYPDKWESRGNDMGYAYFRTPPEPTENNVRGDGPFVGISIVIPKIVYRNGLDEVMRDIGGSDELTGFAKDGDSYKIIRDKDLISDEVFYDFGEFKVLGYVDHGLTSVNTYLIYNDSQMLFLQGNHYEEEIVLNMIESLKFFEGTDAKKVKSNNEVREYVSEDLGIRFEYARVSGDYVTNVVRSGTRIQFGTAFSEEEINDLEVFTFNKNLSHQEGIKSLFLDSQVHDEECFVEILTYENYYPDNYEQALISHPLAQKVWDNADLNAEPWFMIADEYCPARYSHSNGRQFFFYNKEVPGKVVYVRTGQDYSAFDGEGNDWSYSLEIF